MAGIYHEYNSREFRTDGAAEREDFVEFVDTSDCVGYVNTHEMEYEEVGHAFVHTELMKKALDVAEFADWVNPKLSLVEKDGVTCVLIRPGHGRGIHGILVMGRILNKNHQSDGSQEDLDDA